MKRILVVLLVISMLAAPAYALNVIDATLCKKVFLRAVERTVLVNRMTGEVKCIMQKGQWIPLMGTQKREYQSMYNAQLTISKQRAAQ